MERRGLPYANFVLLSYLLCFWRVSGKLECLLESAMQIYSDSYIYFFPFLATFLDQEIAEIIQYLYYFSYELQCHQFYHFDMTNI